MVVSVFRKIMVFLLIALLWSPFPVIAEEERFRQEQRDTFHQAEVLSLAWDYDGNQALATGSRIGKIWISYPGLRLPGFSLEAENQSCVRAISWTSESALLLAGTGDYLQDGSYSEGWIFLWDTKERLLRFATKVSDFPVLTVAVHPSSVKFALGVGALLSSSSPLPEAEIQFWDVDQKSPFRVLKLGNGSITAVSWSPDGEKLASTIWRPLNGDLSGEARIWQGENLDQYLVLGYKPYTSVSWSPDGRKLALGFGSAYWEPEGEVGGFEIFDLDKSESKLVATWNATVKSVSWSPDGSLIACGDNQGVIRIYTAEGNLKQKIERHWDAVNGVSWKKTPEGTKPVLASVSDDGTIRTFTLKPPTFSDLGWHWAEDYIDSLVERGAVNGFPDNTFRPDALVTRAQAVKIILLSLGIQAAENASLPYSDLPPEHWAYGYIASAQLHGLVKGYPDGTFKPEKFVSRAEILAMLARAMGWDEISPSTLEQFPLDVPLNDWASGYLGALLSMGALHFPDPPLISEEGLFNPSREATRAEACFLVERALRKGKLLI